MRVGLSGLIRLAVLAALGSQGCAAIGLALLSAGVGTGAGQGVSYTLDSIAYKTFTLPVDDLETATLRTLNRMDIPVTAREHTESGITIEAKAGDRDIDIDLDRLTARTSRMRVNVKVNWILKDRATAVEIIQQTSTAADEQVRLAKRRPALPVRQPQGARSAPTARPVAPTVKAQATAPQAQPTASQRRMEQPWAYQSAIQGL
jgi:hypothetical protein